jgi:hypothetical protein
MSCSVDMQHGDIDVNYGHAEWTCSTGMQHGKAVWTCTMTSSMNMLNGHGTWKRDMDMEQGHNGMDKQHKDMDMEHGHTPRTCSTDIKLRHAKLTCMIDKQHGKAS